MKVEIIFHTTSTPKVVDAHAIYTKGALLCVELEPDGQGEVMIFKYPLCNVFSVCHRHGWHMGTSKIVAQEAQP